jgi:hypothetical protein
MFKTIMKKNFIPIALFLLVSSCLHKQRYKVCKLYDKLLQYDPLKIPISSKLISKMNIPFNQDDTKVIATFIRSGFRTGYNSFPKKLRIGSETSNLYLILLNYYPPKKT